MRKVLYGSAAGMLLLLCAGAVYSPALGIIGALEARPAGATIEIAEGRFDKNNYFDLLSFVSRRRDKVIGLKISIAKADKGDNYLTNIEEKQLIIASLGRDQGIEILVDDGRYEHGDYVLDGFYLVKGGGVHQGTSSYGLSSVDEAQIRLNNSLKVKSVRVGR